MPFHALFSRDETVEQKFERLLSQNALGATVSQDSVLVAIPTSLAFTGAVFLGFLLLRPFNSIVYAPRLRHADQKHRPPPLGKGLFAWVKPVFKTNEDEYVEKIGLDATLFLRFARMCRNLFLTLSVVGCSLIIPVNVTKSIQFQKSMQSASAKTAIFLMTPKDLTGNIFWAFVALAYIFNIIVCGFLWWNYRAAYALRRKYLESAEYQNSLSARTLMITDVDRTSRTEQGLLDITDNLRTTPEVPRASVGRNVKDLPDLIEEHEEAVIDLEAVLAKYLKNPNQLPAQRPMCSPSKKDPEFTNKKQKVDAIDYLTARIQRLEAHIKEVRETIDKRDPLSYGFASYETIESAHSVAFAGRNKNSKGSTIQLAPRPGNIIWRNLPLDAKTRRWKRTVNRFWILLLTLLYFIPNALIAIFLAKLANLGLIWNTFNIELNKHAKFWAIVQGVAAPALTSLFYVFLPIIFRRLSIQAGDLTKTSRERHVCAQLYSFFVFNNLFVFSLFSALFGMVVLIIKSAREQHLPYTQIIHKIEFFSTIMRTLCEVSPFWVTWLAQRNLGAAIDLAQMINLAWGSFSRKFLNPTPRQLIRRTAPPPFDYASYYNYFLFYTTVALCFAPLQPIVLVLVAFYFSLDSWMKKYLLLYVFYTKNESGGAFWRVLFNRMLVGTFFSNCVIALLVVARGMTARWMMLGAMVPLPIMLIGLKVYCKSAFDDTYKYYTKGQTAKGVEAPAPIDKDARRRDRVAVRFGHPVLYQKLTVPMVHEKSMHLLSEIYRGRLDSDLGDTAAFSDTYTMKRMSLERPGKVSTTGVPSMFESVAEHKLDYENFKNRPGFVDDASDYASSIGRPDTPGSILDPQHRRARSASKDSERTAVSEASYAPGGLREYREHSPHPEALDLGVKQAEAREPMTPYSIQDERDLLSGAASMGAATPRAGHGRQQDYLRK